MTRTTQASQGSKPWRLDNLPIYSVCEILRIPHTPRKEPLYYRLSKILENYGKNRLL